MAGFNLEDVTLDSSGCRNYIGRGKLPVGIIDFTNYSNGQRWQINLLADVPDWKNEIKIVRKLMAADGAYLSDQKVRYVQFFNINVAPNK